MNKAWGMGMRILYRGKGVTHLEPEPPCSLSDVPVWV